MIQIDFELIEDRTFTTTVQTSTNECSQKSKFSYFCSCSYSFNIQKFPKTC